MSFAFRDCEQDLMSLYVSLTGREYQSRGELGLAWRRRPPTYPTLLFLVSPWTKVQRDRQLLKDPPPLAEVERWEVCPLFLTQEGNQSPIHPIAVFPERFMGLAFVRSIVKAGTFTSIFLGGLPSEEGPITEVWKLLLGARGYIPARKSPANLMMDPIYLDRVEKS